MSVKPITIDLVRERLPQLLHQARDQLGKLWQKPPSWPAQASTVRGISRRMAAAAVLLGGIVHICATFAASVYTSGYAHKLLADRLPLNRMTVLPQQAPGLQILPELAPDMLYAMCRYDLREGAVAVRATVLGPGWALSVHTPRGSNFYVLPGQPNRSTDVSFLLVARTLDAIAIPQAESAQYPQVASPTLEGIVVVRGPIRGLAWTAETEAVLQRAFCRQMRR